MFFPIPLFGFTADDRRSAGKGPNFDVKNPNNASRIDDGLSQQEDSDAGSVVEA